jgi:hypothetical protein
MSSCAAQKPHTEPVADKCEIQAHGVGLARDRTLAYFLHRLLDFREAELQAVAEMYGVRSEDLQMRKLPGDCPVSPLRLVSGCSVEQLNQISHRSVLVRVRMLLCHMPQADSAREQCINTMTPVISGVF